MAKSRMVLACVALAFLPLVAAPPAGAQPAPPVDPDSLIEAQRQALRDTIRPACRPGGQDEEIVVCGRRDDERYRVPSGIVPGSAPAGAAAGGEQRAALAIDTSRCTTVGRNQQCTGGLDVIGIGATLVRAVTQALSGRD